MSVLSNARTHTKETGAPDYDNPVYWDTKFATGQDVGEWLNSGEALLDAVVSNLELRSPSHEVASPRVLHLGPGISKLGTRVRDEFVARGWAGNNIVNVDFSSEAVRLGLDLESKRDHSQAMHWLHADLRSWTDVSRLIPFGPFDAILDKSTSDAIATSRSVTLTPACSASENCPTVKAIVPVDGQITLAPVEILALHLVPLTRKGSMWFALSYSTVRFDNLPYLSSYWDIVDRKPLEAPGGQTSSGAHMPDVYHWMYSLQRK